MIFDYSNYTYVCSCDWLQFSVKLAHPESVELICPEGYRLEILQGNNVFRHRAILWRLCDSAKFFTILWSPYSRKIAADIMTCQVANMLLYSDGVHECYRLLQEVVECYFNSMGRIDICCDFQANDAELAIIRELWTGECYVQGKSEGANWWHSSNSDAGRFVHCMNWGSKSSEIKVKVYNKSREIGISHDNPQGDKPWIVARWQHAGFDVNKVWRLEFSMNSSGLLTWKKEVIGLDQVSNGKWLTDVFLSLYGTRFIVRQNLGLRHDHKNNDPVKSLLVLPKFDKGERLKWRGGEEEPTATSSQITLLRRLVATLDMPAVSCSYELFESLADSILSLCSGKGITSYFNHAYGAMPLDYLQRKFDSVGGGCVEVIEEPNRDI